MPKKNVSDIINMKKRKEKIVMLTCYDYSMAKILSDSSVDILLVGDSVGTVKLGYKDTLSVTVDDIVHHTKAVKNGACDNAMIVSDMPYMSYEKNSEEAVFNAKKLISAGADAVKVEGGKEIIASVNAVINKGIAVIGHLGLMPQSVNKIGGYKVQCRDEESAKILLEDALALQQAGVFSIVLECIPEHVAQIVAEKIDIPVIGIGAGKYCDGQVLVSDDMLGIFSDFKPKFVKQYANLAEIINKAVRNYSDEVKNGQFPQESNTYK